MALTPATSSLAVPGQQGVANWDCMSQCSLDGNAALDDYMCQSSAIDPYDAWLSAYASISAPSELLMTRDEFVEFRTSRNISEVDEADTPTLVKSFASTQVATFSKKAADFGAAI